LVEPLTAEKGVELGSIMGFPCLRARGEFFGMPHHATGELVCKLPASRVRELVAEGVGQAFGPGKKVFKEWVLVGREHETRWLQLLREAMTFAAGQRPTQRPPRSR
jgi:hypothetical protein